MENNQNIPQAKTTPKDFFLNLGATVAIFISSISLINLLFEIVNRIFPDALNSGYYMYGYYSTGIRVAISFLIIVVPVYILINWLLNRDFKLFPEKRNVWIRKVLMYFTLFIAGATVVGDLVSLVYYFLEGEISTRFIWKVIVVLVVSGAIFGYYLYDIIKPEQSGKKSKVFAIILAVIVLASIIGGFFVIGSPMRQRAIKFDQRKISDLSNVQWQIMSYWQKKGELPKASLTELNDPISGYTAPKDPENGSEYQYVKLEDKKFKLCASFNLSSDELRQRDYMTNNKMGMSYSTVDMYYGDLTSANWDHEKGISCFERVVDEQRYPIQKGLVQPIPAI